ncbi:MAG: flippase-like domain-containing protein [Chloroflexi bacterium]|nr:flippase-like domain-containing protein [Chloroflexota bacterium]
MRKFFIALIFFLGIAFVILSFSELQSIAETLKQTDLRIFALALLVQLGWLYNMGMTYRSLYHVVGLEEGGRHLTIVATAANFVNVIAPSVGMGGIAVFVNDGNRRGHPPGKVTAASTLYVFFDYVAFLCVLTLGLVVLVRRHNLETSEVIASLILLAIALGLGILLYIGSRSAEKFGGALAWMARLVNAVARPFTHREYVSEARAHSFATEIAEGLVEVRNQPKKLIMPMLFALNNKALLIVILLLMFLSFNVPFSAGTIIGGFAIGYLFLIVSVTPSGIGVMEGVLALALNSLRVPWSQAVVITLAYRAVTLWFPLGVGALAFRRLQSSNT